MKNRLIAGTRGSQLALAQTTQVISLLKAAHPGLDVEFKEITTSGDIASRIGAAKETHGGVKAMFTKEIEEALIAGEIDFAVHSSKDIPGDMASEFRIAAVLERAPASDVFISKTHRSVAELPRDAEVGTASVRRARQLRSLRPDLRIVPFRGNVPTRLRKLCESDSLDGIVLARAGLERLGFAINGGRLDFDGRALLVEDLGAAILPAAGQGAVALQCLASSGDVAETLRAINHEPTERCLRAERELLRLLDGDCLLPVGASASIEGGLLRLRAIIFPDDEAAPPCAGEAIGEDPELLAREIFGKISG